MVLCRHGSKLFEGGYAEVSEKYSKKYGDWELWKKMVDNSLNIKRIDYP